MTQTPREPWRRRRGANTTDTEPRLSTRVVGEKLTPPFDYLRNEANHERACTGCGCHVCGCEQKFAAALAQVDRSASKHAWVCLKCETPVTGFGTDIAGVAEAVREHVCKPACVPLNPSPPRVESLDFVHDHHGPSSFSVRVSGEWDEQSQQLFEPWLAAHLSTTRTVGPDRETLEAGDRAIDALVADGSLRAGAGVWHWLPHASTGALIAQDEPALDRHAMQKAKDDFWKGAPDGTFVGVDLEAGAETTITGHLCRELDELRPVVIRYSGDICIEGGKWAGGDRVSLLVWMRSTIEGKFAGYEREPDTYRLMEAEARALLVRLWTVSALYLDAAGVWRFNHDHADRATEPADEPRVLPMQPLSCEPDPPGAFDEATAEKVKRLREHVDGILCMPSKVPSVRYAEDYEALYGAGSMPTGMLPKRPNHAKATALQEARANKVRAEQRADKR